MNIVREGTIVSGVYAGWKILVDDDRDGDTGGYYLYLKESDTQGFDHWYEKEEYLQNQLDNFDIAWYPVQPSE